MHVCIFAPHIFFEVGRASLRRLSPLCLPCDLHRRPHPVVEMVDPSLETSGGGYYVVRCCYGLEGRRKPRDRTRGNQM